MPNPVKDKFLAELKRQTGSIVKLPKSNSLFEVGQGAARIYIRYSKVHDRGQTFFGLRRDDLRQLEGHPSFVVFLWDDQALPLFLPFGAYEEVLRAVEPASDGQYKAQIYLGTDSVELYLARLGRFNLEGLFGWSLGSSRESLRHRLQVLSYEIRSYAACERRVECVYR